MPVAPVGNPDTESATAFEKDPFCGVTVMVYVAVPPGCIVCAPLVDVTVNVGGGVPVPLRVVDCGEPEALSATSKLAEKLVADAGVNVM